MLKKRFITFILFLFIINCSGSQKTFTEQKSILEKYAEQRYGTSFNVIYNSERSFTIVVKLEAITSRTPNPVLQFFIYDMLIEKIIFEDNVPGGKIAWNNNYQIEISYTPGMISKEDGNKVYGYIYDVRLKTKIVK